MQEFERIDLLLQEIGHVSESIEAIIRNGDDNWEIYVSGHVEMNLDHDHEGEVLCLTIEIGIPISQNKLQHFRSLLQFNLLSDHTGGVVVGLDDLDCVHLSAELPVSMADRSTLQAVIENCASKVLTWRSFLCCNPIDEPGLEDSFDNQSGL